MVLEPRGQQADDARMPIGAGGDDDGRPIAAGKLGIGLHSCRGQHFQFHLLPLLIKPVQRLGDGAGFDGIVGGEQAAAECCVADAPPGIDARADQIGQMEGADRLADARDPCQRRQPLVPLLARHLQPLHHEGAVDAGQRHHVANGR